MLRSLFLYIRQKPKGVRSQIALALSTAFTGVVATLWIMGQTSSPAFTDGPDFVSVPEYGAPFSGLINQVKDQMAAVKGSLDKIATTTDVSEVDSASNETAVTMTLSPETIASTSDSLAEEVATSSTITNPAAAEGMATGTSSQSYRVIQIATSTRPTATTTPSL